MLGYFNVWLTAGLAGLTVAIEVAKYRDVLVLIKNELTLNASAWAQGGIVGVLDKKDSFELHVADTLEAGAGIVLEAAARYLTLCQIECGIHFHRPHLRQSILLCRDSEQRFENINPLRSSRNSYNLMLV